MATELSVQEIPSQQSATLTFTAADAVNGNEFLNDGKTAVLMNNTDAGAQTVTFTGNLDPDFGCQVEETVNLAAGAIGVIGDLKPLGWNQAGSKVVFTASDAAVEVAIYKFAV